MSLFRAPPGTRRATEGDAPMRHPVRTALFAASSLLTAQAHAEDIDDDVVVTATRVPTPARELPADVSLIDADTALSRGQTTLVQAIEEIAGLNIAQGGSAGQQASLFLSGANSYHTLVLFDGLRINDPASPNSAFDAGQEQISALARVEVVEGPMSALFGSDAIGGAINLIPRHGGAGPMNARLDLMAGSDRTRSGAAGIDGTLGPVRYALTAEAYASEGHDLIPARMSTHTGDRDGAEMSAFTGVFDFALRDDLALDLLVRRREARADFDPFLFDASFNELRADDPDLEIGVNSLALARLGATWRLRDGLSLRAALGALEQDREQRDNGLVTDSFAGERRLGDLTLDWRAGALAALQNVSIVAGVFAEREEIAVAQGFGFSPPNFFTVGAQEQAGAFLTTQGAVGSVRLTGAVRADHFEGFGTHTTWRTGASIELNRATRLYASYGTSFRAPTLYERFVSFGNPDLEPEHGESWEIGADASLAAFGRADGVEIALLYRTTDLEDMIDFGPLFTYDNVDLAEIEMGEARISLRPYPWIVLHGAYTRTETADVLAGAPLLRRPAHGWFAAAELIRGAFSGRLSWREVGERRDFLYGDDGYALGQGEAAAYGIVRLSGAYDFSQRAQLYVAVENALDATYEPVNGFAGAPATVQIGLRFRSSPSVD